MKTSELIGLLAQSIAANGDRLVFRGVDHGLVSPVEPKVILERSQDGLVVVIR